MTQDTEERQAQLRWHCRRGMQELDILLSRWLDERWPEASPEMRDAFELLLECEDDKIWSWVMGREEPHLMLAEIVNDIVEQGAKPEGK